MKKISFVIPIYNEEKSIEILCNRLIENALESYEIMLVNDGSTDKSAQIIKQLAKQNLNIIPVYLEQNQGKSEALKAGFKIATGDTIVIMDADLQDEPKDLHKFLVKIDEGFDLVCGYRKGRKASFEKKFRSIIFNFIFRKISKLNLHDCNCGFKVFTKDVAQNLCKIEIIHSYLALQVQRCGFNKITEVEISNNKRLYGKSKYGFKRYITGLVDTIKILSNR